MIMVTNAQVDQVNISSKNSVHNLSVKHITVFKISFEHSPIFWL